MICSSVGGSAVWLERVCGMECSGRLGIPPTLYCDMCMSAFHPECVGFSYLGRHVGFLCRVSQLDDLVVVLGLGLFSHATSIVFSCVTCNESGLLDTLLLLIHFALGIVK